MTGLLFSVALALWLRLVGAVPSAATAPALIVVGSLMMSHAGEIPWSELAVAIPAFLTILTIPLPPFSIATRSLSFGSTAYALLKLVRGESSGGVIGWFTLPAALVHRAVCVFGERLITTVCWSRDAARQGWPTLREACVISPSISICPWNSIRRWRTLGRCSGM